MKNKNREIFLKNYGALVFAVGCAMFIAGCIIVGVSSVDYMGLSARADGSHGSGVGLFFTTLVGFCGLLIFPLAIYYCVCGRRMLDLRYALRGVRTHARIILVLSSLQIVLAIVMLRFNVLLDASYLGVLLLLASIALAIASIRCLVVYRKGDKGDEDDKV